MSVEIERKRTDFELEQQSKRIEFEKENETRLTKFDIENDDRLAKFEASQKKELINKVTVMQDQIKKKFDKWTANVCLVRKDAKLGSKIDSTEQNQADMDS